MNRSYPLSIAVLGSVRLGANDQDEKDTISELVRQGLQADQNRAGWLARQRSLTKLRFGMRAKKDFPWPNCSNLSIPLIDAQIRRHKPLLMRLVVQPDPVCEFVGENPEAVESERAAEAEYNWLFKINMNAVEPLAYIIDDIDHRGYGIAQIGWDYKTEYECRVVDVASLIPQPPQQPGAPPTPPQPIPPEQSIPALAQAYDLDLSDPRIQRSLQQAADSISKGALFVKLAFKSVVTDRPALWDRSPIQVIAPSRTTDYGDAEWIIVQHVLSLRTLKQKEADGFFDKGFVASIVGDMKKNRRFTNDGVDSGYSRSLYDNETLEKERERIWGCEDEDNVLLWEIYHWKDIDGDGLADRVVSWIHPRTRKKGSSRPYPYPFRRWPFVKFDFEKTSRRFNSPRGISSLLEHIQRETNAIHNARLDAMTLQNAPIYQAPVMSGFKARNFRAIPGTIFQLPLGGRIEPINQDRGGFPASLNEEQFLRQLGETYIGTFDNAVSGLGPADSRTATEVNAATQLAASTASLDTILFQMAMKEVHQMIWELWIDLRPAEVTIRVVGQDPNQAGPQSVTIRKSDIDKKFTLIPTGTIANTNHALELSNAKEALTFFANDQTGLINPQALRSWYFGLLDFRQARKIVNTPQQAQELQTLRQAAASLQQDPGLAAGMNSPVASDVQPDQQTEMVGQPPQ